MTLEYKIRYFVILASLIIFCYQLNITLYHLLREDTVDTSEYIAISEMDSPPIITFCPRQGADSQKMHGLGYGKHWYGITYSVDDLLRGNYYFVLLLNGLTQNFKDIFSILS